MDGAPQPSEVLPPDGAVTAGLPERDRRFMQRAVQQLQAHSALAAFDPDDESAQELFRWAERASNFVLLESYFRVSGVGLRRHEGFPIIQLALEGDASSHPLRRRLDKDQTGLLVCLWLLYHEKLHETDGFRIIVTIDDIYARLASLFRDDRRWPETPFRDSLRFFEKHCLVELNLAAPDFTRGEVALLPTILTTFTFSDAADAQTLIAPATTPPASAP